MSDGTALPDGEVADRVAGLDVDECEWCGAPFPEAAAHLIALYAPDGELYEVEVICSSCDQHGPPMSSRRDRREWASRLETKWSRLERLGWWLIRRAQR